LSAGRKSGACATADPDLFYPIATGIVAARQTSEVRRICAVCQVRRQCLGYAMETHGIWGGTTPEERSPGYRLSTRRDPGWAKVTLELG
jgi:WhiB family redox-sensing transcriptional regulator